MSEDTRAALVQLRRSIRERLRAELLPLLRVGYVVRRASGRPCLICQKANEPPEIEYEVRLHANEGSTAAVHESCYVLWRVESMAVVSRGGPAIT